jgi:uncharacterized coiled-coil protein SlyX
MTLNDESSDTVAVHNEYYDKYISELQHRITSLEGECKFKTAQINELDHELFKANRYHTQHTEDYKHQTQQLKNNITIETIQYC